MISVALRQSGRHSFGGILSGRDSRWAAWAIGATALVVGVGLRLYLAIALYGNYDQNSYEIVANIMLRGGNVYAETLRYNYSPLWAYVLLGLAQITLWLQVDFHIIVRGFLTFVDVADATLIGVIAARTGRTSGPLAFSAYLLNPVTILLVGYHGQFENLALLPLLFALFLAVDKTKRSSKALTWALGTLCLVIKHLSVFSVWMLFVYQFTGRRRPLAIALSMLVFLLSFIPYLPADFDNIAHNVFLYQSHTGFYGTGMLVLIFQRLLLHLSLSLSHGLGAALLSLADGATRLLFFGLMLALPFFAKDYLNLPLVNAMELSAVALLASVYGIAEQYFIIPVVFGSIFLSVPYAIYTAATTIVLVTNPENVHLVAVPNLSPAHLSLVWWLWNLSWLALLGWLVMAVRRPPPRLSNNARVARDKATEGKPVSPSEGCQGGMPST